ncbi:R3H and coiled-coil domain-containing protein 1 isoform X1 [Acyrthosiphon pisum]|uniref:R3H domain-containing protein n=2 Tax=Acyrthosiphon pisum TaxID=7029 RepID=A0A8R2FA28_ACYPI|nr:R3H and coiled-coil domain-containing protein 1 isoform X1 [Acyrthosiphon pisum]|eukprot:XP_008184762.1 PREDICTED: R3H and coiled-coil domain-containing protein 1 isoform X1 [Acyrthosiphon pisum]
MESLDTLNLRVGECSFLEIALADVNRYINTFVLEKKINVVLIFPPLSARNRFLVHTLVQKFFNELNTVSIGSSYGRRIVVYHSSLKPMLCEAELDDAEMHDGNNSSIHRAYRTPNERKAQERLFQSLKPTTVNPSTRSHQRKQSKRPDIPIYIPKALRGLANKTVSNTTSTNNSSDSTPSNKLNANCRVRDDSSNTLYSKDIKGSISLFNRDQHNNIVLASLDSFKFVDLSNEMFINDVNNEFKTSYYDVSSQLSDSLSSSIPPDSVDINECNSNSSITNQTINIKNSNLEDNELESNTTINNCDSVLTRSENVDCMSIQNSTSINLTDRQISDVNDKITTDDALLPQKTTKSMDPILVDDNISDMSNNQLDELHKGNEVVFSSGLEIALKEEHDSNCPHYCLDDSFTSGPLTDVDENFSKNLSEELAVQQSPVLINQSLEIIETNEKKKEKKKKKKKILDVDECSWEDMYDKEDDYIHPLLMKELVSTIGKVQVQCAKEDYRSYQTIEERSGDGECVIEVYGFSSELKTIDLMNQFAAFRKKHFEIIWVDDTHALAVFESPHLADQALNTPLVLVKTRPLKNATKESKLRAATVVALPATRPKTCTAMARRLVSSALGLKMNVSPDLINAERTLLANAKEKKIRDAQQKHDIWNNES